MSCVEIFDWNSFWINIYAGFIYFILGILFSIWLIPRFTVRLIKRRNKGYLNRKTASILRELCEFLTCSQFRDKELNQEHIAIYFGKKGTKNYAFVGLCPMNVFSPITNPKIKIVINDYFKKLEPEKAFQELTQEYSRLKLFRKEIETILSAHSLYLDDKLALKISDLCSDIRGQEIKFSINYEYQDLLEKTQNKRTGVFGIGELFDIYGKILYLIRDLITLKKFEYTIDKEQPSC
jgi:hypothetical protein